MSDWLTDSSTNTPVDLDNISRRLDKTDYANKLQIRQNTSGDVLNSIESFSKMGLHAGLLKAIEKRGYRKPSDIQGRFLPTALNTASHIISKSQSGTGKTAAFAITMLQLINPSIQTPQAICISPTRELAIQTLNEFNVLNEFLNIRIALAIATQSPSGQQNPRQYKDDSKELDEVYMCSQIIIGTPGKLSQILSQRIDMSKLKIVVIDEADSFLLKNNVAMDEMIMKIMRNLQQLSPRVFLFSATFTPEVLAFANRLAPGAEIIESTDKYSVAPPISQYYTICKTENDKYMAIKIIYTQCPVAQSVIFVNSKAKASDLYQMLVKAEYSVSLISSNLSYQEREEQLSKFSNSQTRIMIATNIISRGIDIPQINMVINFDLPYTYNEQLDLESYIHRIGRTARFGRDGVCINLINVNELKVIEMISKSINQRIDGINFFDR